MATPTNPTDGNPPTDATQATNQDQQDSKVEAPSQTSPTSVFVNSEPMREEQVQNAVKFLSHPKVRGSPVIYRRSFLEKKGLTKEEIDEAFKRVPDPPPSATNVNQDAQVKPSSNSQPQAVVQTLQPAAAAPPGTISSMRSRFHWSHAVFAIGLLAVSGAGTAVLIKKSIVPRLKTWIRKVVLEEDDDLVKKIDSKPSLAEEAAAAAKAAAAAATDVAKASQEMLNSKNEERRRFEEFTNLLDVQVREMKSMTNAIRKLEGQSNTQGRASFVDQEDHGIAISNSKIMAMIQRGERPPNIRDINDRPPNPNQQPSNPRLAPRAKPWELSQAHNSSQPLQSQVSSEGLNSKVQDNGVTYQLNGDSSVPWWQQKNVKITEIENGDELKAGIYGQRFSEPPVQRSWVPPQPPPVAMPEAAEAIRRPKPAVQREQLVDDQSVTNPSDVTDELLRVTKISESGGAMEVNGGSSVLNSSVEINGGSSVLNSSEIQEDHSYEQSVHST
ncbi:hypothetical protein ACB098_04G129500 [Castanea mollissima]